MFSKLVPVPSGAVIPERDIDKRPILNCINLGITFGGLKAVDDFNRMIRRCRQRKIDLILTKSISRFARNTLDSLKYIRALKGMGIGIIFEKENINTLETDTELIITFMSAFAQSESESISANVRWGKRQAMKEGKN